jgi:radical SAM protein with 4Fe4S-binding SPASM domain
MITDRIDNITNIPFKRVDPPVPESVKIELTNKCNYRCGFCPVTLRSKSPHVMDFNLFKSITTQLKELGVKEIGLFFMGESFTVPGLLLKSISYLKSIGISYIFLTSNGSTARPLITARCMELGLDSLKWSVNFSDKEQFTRMCGVDYSLFEASLENIKSAFEVRKQYGYTTKLYASSIRYDDSQIEKMQPLLSEHILPYVDQHYWLPLYSMGSLVNTESKIGIKSIAGNPGRYDNQVQPIPCWTLFTEAHIMSDGRVTACGADATGEWVMGDIKTDSFMDIWHNTEFKKLRKEHLNNNVIGTKCEKCNK